MKKYNFFWQKENVTIGALMLLIVMAFVMMRLQYNKDTKNSQYPNSVTSKAKVTIPNQTEIPHFIPAL
jgi:preprotein translocase subunit YajC